MGRRKFLPPWELYKNHPKLSSLLCPRASGPSATCLKSWGQEGNELLFFHSYGSWFWLELGTSVLLHIHHSMQCGLVWASLPHGAWESREGTPKEREPDGSCFTICHQASCALYSICEDSHKSPPSFKEREYRPHLSLEESKIHIIRKACRMWSLRSLRNIIQHIWATG